jgi:hypothetical protein
MAEQQERRKGGGAKLNRSETVTVRFDPKLRYLAELAARRHRRTLSSFVEWAVEKALGDVVLDSGDDWHTSLLDGAPKLWAIHPAERFLRLAQQFPELMSYEEEVIWNAIQSLEALNSWKDADGKNHVQIVTFRSNNKPDVETVKNCWKQLVAYASGELSEKELKDELIDEKAIPF